MNPLGLVLPALGGLKGLGGMFGSTSSATSGPVIIYGGANYGARTQTMPAGGSASTSMWIWVAAAAAVAWLVFRKG